MIHNEPASDEVELGQVLQPLRRRWWLVLGIVVIVTAAAYFVASRSAKVYTATTSIYVNTSENPAAQFEGNQVVTPSTNAVADLARLSHSTAVGIELKRRLHSAQSPNSLLAHVTATPDANADFVNVTATGSTGEGAALLANAYARSFVAVGAGQVAQQLAGLLVVARDQLASLPRGNPSQHQQLVSRIAALRSAVRNVSGPEQQLDPAIAPSTPSSPRPVRVAGIAFILALVNALILVYLIEYFDRRVKRPQDVSEGYGLPMLSIVPHVGNPELVQEGRATLDPDLLESMRFLRVNLSLQALDRPTKLLLVTSALPGEGKTAVVRNLAIAYREAGTDVVVVDADLRRPALSRALGWSGRSPGLTGVLLGHGDLHNAVVATEVSLPGITPDADGREPHPTIGLLPSGGRAANPPAILGSARMAEVLHDMASSHDLVIIDSPPLLAVSDALPLLSVVDGVILVARPGVTTRDAIRRVKAVLRSIPTARVLGTVAEDAKGAAAYGYDYQERGVGAQPAAAPAPSEEQEEAASATWRGG